MNHTCRYCDGLIDRPNAGTDGPGRTRIGRPPLYCSGKCRQAAVRARAAAAPMVGEPESLACRSCAVEKPAGDYYPATHGGGRRQPCKDCHKRKRRDAYAATGEVAVVRERNWVRYGLTPEQYAAMVERQKGLCAICHRPSRTDRLLSVDHDHTTGQVRELLCSQCDAIIGQAHDDESVLLAAVDYLRKHRDVS